MRNFIITPIKKFKSIKKFIIKNKILEKGNGFLIIKKFENSKKKFEKKIYLFEKFTKLVGQNNTNEKIIKVQPRKNLLNKFKKKVKKKLRYHQTNLGGSIHSDGLNYSYLQDILLWHAWNNQIMEVSLF